MKSLLKLTILSVIVFVVLTAFAIAAEEHTQDDAGAPRQKFTGSTEVIATRIGADPVAVGRREIVISRDEIERLPVQTVQDLLRILPGVGLTRRGARGVQGDLNMRGGSFEQAVVMVNGIRVNNPQTGHHNLDLFVPLAAIERIEILYGPGSAVHGPDAFGGAINIVTGVGGIDAYFRIGENDLTGGGIAGALKSGLWAALEREVHSGFRDNTEADVNQGAAGYSWAGGEDNESSLDLMFSAGRRRFGAYAFYSARFPDEREETAGKLLTAVARIPTGPVSLGFALRLDRHDDEFILDRYRPDWYRNTHQTDGALLDVSIRGRGGPWHWVAGVELARDEIDSSNLGVHHRSRGGVFAEIGRLEGRLTYGLQLRLDHQDPWGSVETYAFGGAWEFKPGWRFRLHHGTSFRAPSFTELYYVSPSTVGNPNLAPEEGRTTEIGLDAGIFSGTVFDRHAEPIIDYILDDDGIWRAENIGALKTRGIEAGILLPVAGPVSFQRISAVYVDTDIDVDPATSAYALAHPKFEAAWTGALQFGEKWRSGWALSWREPIDRGSWWTLDLDVGRRILDGMWITLEASNIFDRSITELHGIPLPGRWVSLSLVYHPHGEGR